MWPLFLHSLYPPNHSIFHIDMKRFTFFLFTSLFGQLLAQSVVHPEIDHYVKHMIDRHGIPGTAVAVIQDGEVLHQAYDGLASVEHSVPVGAETRFKLHSLTKIFASTALFHLMESHDLSLNDSLGQHFAELPEPWQQVQIKHLLTHSSGLPDIAFVDADSEEEAKAKVFEMDSEFPAGDHFRYNQSNYWLINRLINQISGQSFESYVREHLFADNPGEAIFAGQNTTIVPHRSTEYESNEAGELVISLNTVPDYMYGAAGLSLSLPTFIRWSQALERDELIKAESKTHMWDRFQYARGDEAPFGWGGYEANGHLSYGFTGGWRVGYRIFPENDLSIILLTNGYTHAFSVDVLIDHIAGLADEAVRKPKSVLREQIWTHFLQENQESALEEYYKLIRAHPEISTEQMLNSLGYHLAGKGAHEKALIVFELNTEQHPDSWNVWDSLAEGLEMAGKGDLAIKYYRQSLDLNPDNHHARDRLADLVP